MNFCVVETFSPSIVTVGASSTAITLFGKQMINSDAFSCEIGGYSGHHNFVYTDVVVCTIISKLLPGNLSVCISNDAVAYSCSQTPLQVVTRNDAISVSPSVGTTKGGTYVLVSLNQSMSSFHCIFGSSIVSGSTRSESSHVCILSLIHI